LFLFCAAKEGWLTPEVVAQAIENGIIYLFCVELFSLLLYFPSQLRGARTYAQRTVGCVAEMFNLFKDTNKEYRDKFRSLFQNINHEKNQILRDRLLSGDITAAHLLTMTHEVSHCFSSLPFTHSLIVMDLLFILHMRVRDVLCLRRKECLSLYLCVDVFRSWRIPNSKHNAKRLKSEWRTVA
jgi:hypothetical protein